MHQLKKLQAPLLRWYDENRRHLPWREEVSAYRTWVSEIMLQQTRVQAVLGYFARFMAAYPTVEALAGSDEGALLKLWEGLGYYSRARNLRRTAQIIVEQYGGVFPDDYDRLMALPGIGDYTAGAILSIAFSQPVPAVDGNVLRLAARITGSDLDVTEGKNRALFRQWMAQAMSTQRPGAYNQALMDLGATVCLPRGAPLCDTCPAGDFCTARQEGTQQQLPLRGARKPRRVEELTVFVLERNGEIALRRRGDSGLLAGLWEYPHVPGKRNEAEAAEQLARWGLTVHHWGKRLAASHEFTHIRWEMTGYVLEVSGTGEDGWRWCGAAARRTLAVPSAFARFTAEIAEKETR